MQSNNLATPTVERLVHLLLLSAIAIVLVTYVVPAVSERLETIMLQATEIKLQ